MTPETLHEIEVAIRTGKLVASDDAADLDAQIIYMGRLLLDHGEALLAAIPRWRPIETAPRDGSRILGFCPGVRSSFVLHYYTWGGRGVWVTWDGGFEKKPTLWMPLPVPKEESRG